MKYYSQAGGGVVTVHGGSAVVEGASEISAEAVAAAEAALMLPERIREECRRRIVAVLSETTQMNLTAARAAGLLTAEQSAAYDAGVQWIGAMRAKYRALRDASDATFAADAHWPALPAGVAALATGF